MKLLLAILCLAFVINVEARGFGGSRSSFSSSRSSFSSSRSSFGGSRSSFSSSSSSSPSSSRSSFFGGSRSSGQAATITRSAPVAQAAPTRTVINNTTVVHRSYNGGSNGLVTGMLIGHAMSQPRQVVVVNGQPQQTVVVGDQPQQQVLVREESHALLWTILVIVIVVSLLVIF